MFNILCDSKIVPWYFVGICIATGGLEREKSRKMFLLSSNLKVVQDSIKVPRYSLHYPGPASTPNIIKHEYRKADTEICK